MSRSTVVKQAQLPVIDNPSAPELFADDVAGSFIINNTVRITFVSARADHTTSTGTTRRVVTGRLVMPLAAVENFHRLLTAALNNMRSSNQTGSAAPNILQ